MSVALEAIILHIVVGESGPWLIDLGRTVEENTSLYD
jgi:hypothetical protein